MVDEYGMITENSRLRLVEERVDELSSVSVLHELKVLF